MCDLKVLNRKRGAIKARLTNFQNFVDDLVNRTSDNNLDKLDILELKSRMNKVENILSEFDDVQTEIEVIASDEEYELQVEQRLNFENSFHKVIAVCTKLLAEVGQHADISDSDSVKSNMSNLNRGLPSNGVVNNSVLALQTRPKLPSIPLPKFNGNSDNWLEFRDTFSSLIHNNEGISNIEKFYFLKGALEGEAKQVIHLVDVSSENYEVTWTMLCERYNNTSMLVNNHLKALFALPTLTKESSADLRHLLDMVTKHLYALQKLDISVETWDPIIIYIMTEKLDSVTHRVWEEKKPRDKVPSLKQFKDFLKTRAEMLATLDKNKVKPDNKHFKPKPHKTFVALNPVCSFCKNKHYINNCPDFLKLIIRERFDQSKKLGLCLNCLKKGNHISKDCKMLGCRKCGAKHHTLLHFETQNIGSGENSVQVEEGNDNREQVTISSNRNLEQVQVTSVFVEKDEGEVLLSTALVQIVDCRGYPHTCRAILDNGSQSNLIVQELADKLCLKQKSTNISMLGINQVKSKIKRKCLVNVQSLHSNYEITVSCLVVPQIGDSIPCQEIDISKLDIPSHLKLADSEFHKPGNIELLLGAGIFYNLLCIGQVHLGNNQLCLQKTRLGWIMTGSFNNIVTKSFHVRCNLNVNVDIQTQLAKFWAIEEPPSLGQVLSPDDKECESIFKKTTKRDRDGRFIVNIPLLDSPTKLGDSKENALNQFLNLEKRFVKNPVLKDMYIKFMKEYETLGHMSLVTSSSSKVSYYLPHHGVIKESSSTTKLRVVFNGSAVTDSGISFNDIQYSGPNLQDELVSILLRFRQHNVIICADVEKMYRMILVDSSQRSLQKILWRSDTTDDIKEYELNTVTYGTRSAPYLAIRCLKQLGLDNLIKNPRAANVILSDFYVDDLLSGAPNSQEAIQLGKLVADILKSGGMNLRKWISNDPLVNKYFNENDNSSDIIHFDEQDQNKTLGLYWSFKRDVLMYSINFSSTKVNTKRLILSDVSRIYDPLGLLGPCIIIAKVLLQKLWSENLSWDETLPLELDSRWMKLRNEFYFLNNLCVPRQVVCQHPIRVDIHGFSDASIEAFGACVYIRSVSDQGQIKVTLIFAKVKVAPLKSLTIPRLELCGALLLAKLITKVKESMSITFQKTFLWCDSTVVLGWINNLSNSLQSFVRNRVGQILELTKQHEWKYVKSTDNPADILSRGLLPTKILKCHKWWEGPEWLSRDETNWPAVTDISVNESSLEKDSLAKIHLIVVVAKFPFEKFNCLHKLKRVISYCYRFICCVRSTEPQFKGYIKASELDHALNVLIKISQKECFAQEINDLRKQKLVSTKSIASLNPYIDENGFLRVGGRLELSQLDYEKKHPILLSSKHRFTLLLFETEHKRLLHAGPQLLLSSIRELYWVIGGRNLARKVTHKCITCFRVNPKPFTQIMGNLPKERVCPQPPFHTVGLDYAGPFLIRDRCGRKANKYKCYLCIFVCFTIKAVHLEVVSDLTTEAFIATFRRFVSRRGKPHAIYSDNGTNLVGANTELKLLGQFLKNESPTLSQYAENEGVSWKFIPANSPNFGGLWESGVKSCKFHLKRVMANVILTFEGFCTLLAQVEAVLNSRPLVPLSSDPNDMDVLTPSHFLIGRRLTSLPDPDVKDIPLNRLSRFQHIQMIYQHFWKRWSKEYLAELQQRTKWNSEKDNVQIGQLVLVKDDNLPPLLWKLGRIVEVFPGLDKKVRVVKLKTQFNEIKRAITRLCPLPVQ